MAKAIFNRLAQKHGMAFRAESAGTQPAERLHEVVIRAMDEVGIDLSQEKPQLLTNEMVERATRVITMGCGVDSDACPAVYLKDVVDWGLPDPAGQPIKVVREVRGAIRRLVEDLMKSMN
jgi:arsenate reductase